jgi:DNA-dependent protein kinase catalytic subunit
MSPIGTAGLFRATMIHTMNALRENSDLLLSTMDVFIKEPLMEWMVNFIDLLIRQKKIFNYRNMQLKQVNK